MMGVLRRMKWASGTNGWQCGIPNFISLARISAAPFLLIATLEQNLRCFQLLLVACLLSDILDGWLARTFNWSSGLGARLDSTGDILVQFVAFGGLWIFYRETVVAHWVALLIVVSLYLLEAVFALIRYGKISSFHTVLVRVAASALGIFAVSLFLWGYVSWFFYPAMGLAILAYTEELFILYFLAEWTPNVGGLYQVLAQTRYCPPL